MAWPACGSSSGPRASAGDRTNRTSRTAIVTGIGSSLTGRRGPPTITGMKSTGQKGAAGRTEEDGHGRAPASVPRREQAVPRRFLQTPSLPALLGPRAGVPPLGQETPLGGAAREREGGLEVPPRRVPLAPPDPPPAHR